MYVACARMACVGRVSPAGLLVLVTDGVCAVGFVSRHVGAHRHMKLACRYVQLVFNVSKVGILIYAVQKPASGT
jgi:hypothetical protein